MLVKIFIKSVLFSVFFGLFIGELHSQNNKIGVHAITYDFGLSYERNILDKLSLIGRLGYTRTSGSWRQYPSLAWDITTATIEGRYYISNFKDLSGLHIGGFYSYQLFAPYSLSENSVEPNINKFKRNTYGFSLGYNFRIIKYLNLNFFGSIDNDLISLVFPGVWDNRLFTLDGVDYYPRLGMSFSYSF